MYHAVHLMKIISAAFKIISKTSPLDSPLICYNKIYTFLFISFFLKYWILIWKHSRQMHSFPQFYVHKIQIINVGKESVADICTCANLSAHSPSFWFLYSTERKCEMEFWNILTYSLQASCVFSWLLWIGASHQEVCCLIVFFIVIIYGFIF
jgi:hypothetical protein